MKIIIFSFLVLGIFMCTCTYKKYELPIPETTPNDSLVENKITYTNFTKRMIENNHCLECHSGPSPAAGRDYTTYNGIKAVADNGLLKIRAIDNVPPSMPYGYPPLAQNIKDSLQLWLDQGALE